MAIGLIKGHLTQERDTVKLAQCFAPFLQEQRTCMHLNGPLGVGKTALVRALLRFWGYKGPVKSPTYTLMEHYSLLDFTVLHVDLYRIEKGEATLALGLEESLEEAQVTFIEWPCSGLPPADVTCALDFAQEHESRLFTLQAHTTWGEVWLSKVMETLPSSLSWYDE